MKSNGRSLTGRLARQESGFALVMSILVFIIMLILGIAIIVTGFQEINLSARTRVSEEAYSIAEAGINRAAMELQTNADLRNLTAPVFPTPLQTPKTESFGGGSYTWSVYQSETSTDYRSKVIRSLGTIKRAGRTAERMIETRVVVDIPGEGYDASFDYLIYNGMNQTGGIGTWWPGRWYNSGLVAGNYTYDGSEPYEGHKPKGAIYTRGSIKLPVSVFGDLVIKGNTVATDVVDIQNTWQSNWNDPGVYIPSGSKVIAGLDGFGSAIVRAVATSGGITSSVKIDGEVIASDHVTVTATANVGLRETLRIGGIKAGRDVNIKGTVNISGGLSIGNIVAGRMTDIRSRWLSGITVSNIRSGQGRDSTSPDRDGEDPGTGVYLDSVAASRITAANIVSTGRVHAYARAAGVNITSIQAGDDFGLLMGNTGTGVRWDIAWLGGTSIGDITARGMVDLQARNVSTINCSNITAGSADLWGSENATGVIFRGTGLSTINTRGGDITSRGDVLAQVTSGSNITTGAITCGRNVDLNCGEWIGFDDDMTINGPIAAVGYVNLTTGDNIRVNGSITSGNWVRVWSTAAMFSFSGNNDIDISGSVAAGSATIPAGFPGPVQGPGEDGKGAGWSVYIENTNDFPAASDDLSVGSVSSMGQVSVKGNDIVTTGDIASNSNVLATWSLPWWGSGNSFYLGSIHAGGYAKVYTDAEVTGQDDSINTGAITAGSYVELEGHDEIRVYGSILANGNVKLESTYKDITAGNPVEVFGGIRSRGHVRIFQDVVDGDGRVSNGIWANSVDVRKTSWIWPWQSDFRIGNIGDGPNQDSIRAAAGGGVRNVWVNEENGGEIVLGGGNGDIRMQTGSQSPSISGDVSYRSNQYSNVSLPAAVSGPGLSVPVVGVPSLPAKPAVPTVTRNAGGDIDVLNEAGLEGPVNLLMPNWQYFSEQALADDASVNPDPTAGPNPPHVIVDGGPGDRDGARNDVVVFEWEPWGSSEPYSSNETVYVDSMKRSWSNLDPEYDRYCKVVIRVLDWSGEEANFQGTIVTRGHVEIDVGSASDWELNGTQSLNIVAGGDVKVTCGGVTNFALWKNNDSHLHFWAYRDIDLENTTLSLTGNMSYYGSFTAGNEVKLADNNFWPDTTLKWSRWALDPVAWVPPFEVLTWKEL